MTLLFYQQLGPDCVDVLFNLRWALSDFNLLMRLVKTETMTFLPPDGVRSVNELPIHLAGADLLAVDSFQVPWRFCVLAMELVDVACQSDG
jgi:hypothetical protein